MEAPTLLEQVEGRLAGLRQDRYSWWVHWAELAKYILPRRYRWLITPNQYNRGAQINGAIIDSTGTIAARVLASGMMSGITSPTRPWFDLVIEGYDNDEINPVTIWLAEVKRRMMRVFQESNFYNCIAVVYGDLGVFGTAPMLIHEDFENVIRCENPCAGEYYIGLDKSLTVNIFYREIVKTVAQLVQEFGEENCSPAVCNAYRQKGTGLTQEIAICHAIEPNPGTDGIPSKFAYRELYWERGNASNQQGKPKFLRKRGYFEYPGICPRWDVTGNDAYGRSPGMEALGDIKQLQQETKRKAQAIDKLANPPMVADVELKNQPASTLPGGVTYTTKKDGAGFKPAYENFRPPIMELMQDIAQVQQRIKSVFLNDIFMMFQQMEAEPRSAAAVDVRREERLIQLGPVLERFQTEALDGVIDRTFAIMSRARLIPPAPPEIQNSPIQVQYSSMLAQAQKAAATAGIERMLGLVGSVAQIDPTATDEINISRTVHEYGSQLMVPPSIYNTEEEKQALRQGRAKQKAEQDALNAAPIAADTAKTLSETPVGAGKSALETMLNPSAVPA